MCLHRSDKGADAEDQQDVADVRADDVAQGDAVLAFDRCRRADDELGRAGAIGYDR